jgi:hypothetical protein
MADSPPPYPPTNPTQDPVPPAGGAKPKASLKTWIAAGAAAVVLALIGGFVLSRTGSDSPSSAAASSSGNGGGVATAGGGQTPGRRGTSGTITAIKGSTISLAPDGGSGSSTAMTVTTSSDTVVLETVDGAVSDIAVGDTVIVIGEESDGTVAATSVTDAGTTDVAGGLGGPGGGGDLPQGEIPQGELPDGFTPPSGGQLPQGGELPQGGQLPSGGVPGGAGGGFTRGTVTGVSGSTITVEAQDGSTVTVTTSSDTTVSVTKEISLSDLAVGDTITANGTVDGTTVAATRIQKGDLGGFGGFPGGGNGGPASGQAPSGSNGTN